jgi:hypothetical protein
MPARNAGSEQRPELFSLPQPLGSSPLLRWLVGGLLALG